jgi:hypothetical protein
MKYGTEFRLSQILSEHELQQAQRFVLEASSEGESAHDRITAEIIEPNLARINEATGQENDARYLGYAIEFVLRANLLPIGSTNNANHRA